MRVILICGSLDPGRDGVGDYSRRLAGGLIRQGYEIAIIALSDKGVDIISEDFQFSEGTMIPVLRIPEDTLSRICFTRAGQYITTFNPDWISLQYVPFSFHKKGLPLGLGKQLAKIGKGKKWHIMFHELWCGMNENAPIKEKVLGLGQKIILKLIVFIINPKIIFTSTNSYAQRLKIQNIDSKVVPIFGNINITQFENEKVWEQLISKFNLQELLIQENKLLLCFFGSIHTCKGLIELIEKSNIAAEQMNRKLTIIFLGRGDINYILKNVQHIPKINCINIGEQKSEMINSVLKLVDLGVMTTPADGLNKSGSAIAFIERAIPVIIPWQDTSCKDSDLDKFGVYRINESVDVIKAFSNKGKRKPEERLVGICNIYINYLSQ